LKFFSLLISLLLITCSSVGAQDWAKAKLEKSPRHSEWVTVKEGERNIRSFITYPEVKGKAPSVVVIHEIFGLSDWVRSVADQLAAAGYIAIAPDLLSGTASGGGGTDGFSGEDAVRKAVSGLPPEQITKDLNAVTSYVSKLPAANGKVAVAGFCWGGGQTFRFASDNPNIRKAFVFYGSAPEEAELKRIVAPVEGFYAENDARINATIDQTIASMKKLGKQYKPVVYKGAGHGFMRAGEAPDAKAGNKEARSKAWKRWLEVLRKM